MYQVQIQLVNGKDWVKLYINFKWFYYSGIYIYIYLCNIKRITDIGSRTLEYSPPSFLKSVTSTDVSLDEALKKVLHTKQKNQKFCTVHSSIHLIQKSSMARGKRPQRDGNVLPLRV